MKRQLISLMIILPLLTLFSSLEVYAQGGDPIIGPPPPKPLKLKPAAKSARKIKRASLTAIEYIDRYRQIYEDYTNRKVLLDGTVTSLENLVKQATEDSTRSITYQFLGLLYLHGRNDAANAEAAMEQAIKAKGSAIVEISFDNKWRPMKLRSGTYVFEDKGLGWIKIESGKLTFTDRTNKPLMNDKTEAILTGQEIKELSKKLVSAFPLVEITAYNTRRPYLFAAGAMRQDEAELVIKLIKKHVQGKAN
jgi:hypothetical protein